jgi:hypothetical protein
MTQDAQKRPRALLIRRHAGSTKETGQMHRQTTPLAIRRQGPPDAGPHTVRDLLIYQLHDLAAEADRMAGRFVDDSERDLRVQLQNLWMLTQARRGWGRWASRGTEPMKQAQSEINR